MYRLVMLPEVFALPANGEGRISFERFLGRLLSWASVLNEEWISITASEETSKILADHGRYPIYPILIQLFKELQIIEYSVNDIVQVVNKILTRAPSFELDCDVREILAAETAPADTMEAATLRIHQIVACVNQHLLSESCLDYIVISCLTEENGFCTERVCAQIVDIEHCSVPSPKLPLPILIDFQIKQCSGYRDLLANIDTSEYWRYISEPTSAEHLIRVRWFQECYETSPVWSLADCPRFRIGVNFLSSARALGFMHQTPRISLLLDRVCDLFLRRNLSKTHALRTGPGGNDPQEQRGEDKAFRADLDYEFHLHYWLLPNSELEFASIVTHNDFSIPK